MFSLLSPFVLWLTPLIAVPLAIALMGRAQPKTRDFPSLLPVRASLQRAMKKHRLKSWLQLILRTLILLCLLLAAAGLQWRGRQGGRALAPPATSGLFWHNGAYALAPSSSGTDENVLVGQRLDALRTGLDSLAQANQGRLIVEPLFPEGELVGAAAATSGRAAPGRRDPRPHAAARFGAPPEAAARLLQTLGAGGGGGEHAFIPVFAARDLVALAPAARPWLEANPAARLVLIDYGAVTGRLKIFGHVTATTTGTAHTGDQADMMTLRVTSARPQGFVRAPAWHPAGSAKQGAAQEVPGARQAGMDGTSGPDESGRAATLTFRLPETTRGARWIAGTFAMAAANPAHPEAAVTEHPVAYRIPPPAALCHVGSRASFLSLASLGEGGERVRVRSLDPTAAVSETTDCDLLYLADPPELSAAWLTRAAAILRSGGTVILETGRHTDAALWNRNFLVPFEVGRLTEVVTTPAAPVRPVAHALQAAGLRAERWGDPGAAATYFGFQPAAGTAIWLRAQTRAQEAASAQAAVLVSRRVGAGRLLLWTTSLADPAWSDLGLGPWPALVHQGLFEGAWAAGIQSHHADTDSLAWWPARAGARNAGAGDRPPQVTDPDGDPFGRVRGDAGGWWIGPFDRPGLYRITPAATRDGMDGEAAWLAVGLATPPPAPRAADWAAFYEGLGPDARSRVVRLGEHDDWRTLYTGVNLRFALLALAALLLFTEGVLSLRLAHGTPR